MKEGSVPGNMEARYYPGEGKVEFLDPFSGNIANDVGRSKIYIKYKF